MLWYKPTRSLSRRAVLLGGATLLAACGFEPVYGPGGRAESLSGRIDVLPPADEEGRALSRRLEKRLGFAEAPDLILGADIAIKEEELGILPDGSISRYHVIGRVDWTLTRNEETVLKGREQSFTAYSATSTTVATITAQRSARERLMTLLADRIVADILANADAL
jgi:LPS-assembly lipoprotein